MSQNRNRGDHHLPPPSGFADFRVAYAFAEFICGQFAKTIEVFFRHDFGERYFNIINLYGSSFTFGLYAIFAGTLLAGEGEGKEILGLFLFGFIIVGIVHQLKAVAMKRKGRRWHSRYPGTSYLASVLNLSPYIIQRYIEPTIAIAAGYLLYNTLNRPLGLWLVFAGLCLAATEQINAARVRNRILDAIDAQIEAQNIGAAIAGNKTPEQTEGFVLPVPSYYSEQQRKTLVDGMIRLDPALAAIMDTPEATEAEEREAHPTQNV